MNNLYRSSDEKVIAGVCAGLENRFDLNKDLIGKEFVHFKGGHYRLVGYAKDSETMEPMCVYEALYGSGGLWVRPAKMFFENVEKPGYFGPRFKLMLNR